MRTLMLASLLVLAGALGAAAQNHPPSHSDGRSHDGSSHVPLDPGLHALMHGDWQGTMSAPGGATDTLALKVAADEGRLTFRMTSGHSSHLGVSSQVERDGDSVRWLQDVSGTPCNTVASVAPATPTQAETVKGTMSCAGGVITFALQKVKK